MSGWNLRTGAAITMLALTVTTLAAGPASAAAPAVYYVDAVNGRDTAAGTSPATAWKTLSKASAARLDPGDRLLLSRGSTWRGQQLRIGRSGPPPPPPP